MMFGKHRHRLHIYGVDHPRGSLFATAGLPQTVVLFRCDEPEGPGCMASKILPGQWDMHDLAAMPSSWPDEITGPHPVIPSTEPPETEPEVSDA